MFKQEDEIDVAKKEFLMNKSKVFLLAVMVITSYSVVRSYRNAQPSVERISRKEKQFEAKNSQKEEKLAAHYQGKKADLRYSRTVEAAKLKEEKDNARAAGRNEYGSRPYPIIGNNEQMSNVVDTSDMRRFR